MKRKWLFKNLIVTSVCFGAMVLLGTGSSKAVLQSNGNDGVTYNLSDWMLNVRKMEELGGAMGLSESLNDNLTTNGDSNNIDVHMQKNTEYGALAILSASSYGNPNKINSGETTTGNVTGVVMKFNAEWTAARRTDVYVNCLNRYINTYERSYTAKIGDALYETYGWHNATAVWFGDNASGIVRSLNSSIFSFYARHQAYNNDYTAAVNRGYYSRAVVVQGEGI